jgi:hypothetical protein
MMDEYVIEGTEDQLNLMLEAHDFVFRIGNGELELIAEIIQPFNDPNGSKLRGLKEDILRLKTKYMYPLPIEGNREVFEIEYNTITCSEFQLRSLSWACDLVSRIQICQFDRVADVIEPSGLDPDFKRLWAFRGDLDRLKSWWGMSSNASYGIFSTEVPDTARTLWDIHQVIRNRLAYDSHPGITPQNRWAEGKFTVDFDEPFHADKETPLIKVRKRYES